MNWSNVIGASATIIAGVGLCTLLIKNRQQREIDALKKELEELKKSKNKDEVGTRRLG